MSCLECKYCDDTVRRNDCIKCNHPESPWQWCDTDISCRRFTQKPPTVFDKITQSPKELAPKLVYRIPIIGGCKIMYSSSIIDCCYDSREKAERATLKRLKEVAG